MKASFLEEMKSLLIIEQQKLSDELARLSGNSSSTGAFDADYETLGDKEDENAGKVAEMGDALALDSELSTALRDVEGALAAVENGTYGVCKYCQQDIDENRLRARPTSTSCVACKKTLTQEL